MLTEEGWKHGSLVCPVLAVVGSQSCHGDGSELNRPPAAWGLAVIGTRMQLSACSQQPNTHTHTHTSASPVAPVHLHLHFFTCLLASVQYPPELCF